MLITSFDLNRVLTFLEPYCMGNLLASEFQGPSSMTYPYIINEAEACQLGLELQRRYGFESTPYWGVCKVVYLHRTAVIKIPIHETYAPFTTQEIDEINTRWPDPIDNRHFPFTVHVGNGIAVQERCRLSVVECQERRDEIAFLASSLGLWDVYDEINVEVRDDNVGFELRGSCVKFFDVQSFEVLKKLSCVRSTRERFGSPEAA